MKRVHRAAVAAGAAAGAHHLFRPLLHDGLFALAWEKIHAPWEWSFKLSPSFIALTLGWAGVVWLMEGPSGKAPE